jgi:hypothetical protein
MSRVIEFAYSASIIDSPNDSAYLPLETLSERLLSRRVQV